MMDDSSNGFRIVDRSGKAEDSKLQSAKKLCFVYLRYHYIVDPKNLLYSYCPRPTASSPKPPAAKPN